MSLSRLSITNSDVGRRLSVITKSNVIRRLSVTNSDVRRRLTVTKKQKPEYLPPRGSSIGIHRFENGSAVTYEGTVTKRKQDANGVWWVRVTHKDINGKKTDTWISPKDPNEMTVSEEVIETRAGEPTEDGTEVVESGAGEPTEDGTEVVESGAGEATEDGTEVVESGAGKVTEARSEGDVQSDDDQPEFGVEEAMKATPPPAAVGPDKSNVADVYLAMTSQPHESTEERIEPRAEEVFVTETEVIEAELVAQVIPLTHDDGRTVFLDSDWRISC